VSFIQLIFSSVLNFDLFFVFVFFINILGILIYKRIAINLGILANPNFRTLHETSVPRGAGIVFSSTFVLGVFVLFYFNFLSKDLFFILGFGGAMATIFGLIDDIFDIRAIHKFLIQICLSIWMLIFFDDGALFSEVGFLATIKILLFFLFIVWMINAYNFMDGIDGMAISGAFYVSFTLTLITLITNGSLELVVLFTLLMASTGAFMLFNWPPASIFMGDSGSIFLGYLFGSFILITIIKDEISLWTWLVIFGYFFADTTVTQIARIILVKNFLKPHRSHAYQNLARITGSHLKVTGWVTFYHIFWLLPLSIWTVLIPNMELIAVFFAIIPGFIIAYRYGPVFSSS
jgi:Fuc2NAc and GlcNAc transferase